MAVSYRALCSDFYVNQKLSVKLDLPGTRETVLDLFERVRKSHPNMQSFRRYEDELALESEAGKSPQQWLAIRSSTIRSGVVNPESFEDAYGLHRCVLEVAPYFLSISPLDLEYLELLFGFDLVATGAHDAIVAAALLGDSPLSALLDIDQGSPIDFQPVFGLRIGDASDGLQAHFEVKTRQGSNGTPAGPISVYLTVRKTDPGVTLEELPAELDRLAEHGEQLVHSTLVPSFLSPVRDAIAASGG